MNSVQEILSQRLDPESFAKGYCNHLREVIVRVDPLQVALLIEVFLSA